MTVRVFLSLALVRKAIGVGRVAVLERVRRAMGSSIVGGNRTCCGCLACTLEGGLYGGSSVCTLGAGCGGTDGISVRLGTLGDRRSCIAEVFVGAGCVVGRGWVVPCPTQLRHALRNAVMALSCASCTVDGASVNALVRV